MYFTKSVALAAMLAACASASYSQQAVDGEAEPPQQVRKKELKLTKDWEFELALYGWLPWINSDTTLYDNTATIDADGGDVLDVLKFAGFAHAEAARGRWGIMGDLVYAKLGESSRVKLQNGLLRPGVKVDATLTMIILESGLYYRLGDDERSFDVLAGARYFDLETDIEFGPLNIDPGVDWLDPYIGGRYSQRISDKWSFSLRADVGGFGVGSDSSFNGSALLRYALTDNVDLGIGYRYLDVDYKKSNFEFDTQMHGPLVGIAFKF